MRWTPFQAVLLVMHIGHIKGTNDKCFGELQIYIYVCSEKKTERNARRNKRTEGSNKI
jgi:hypothetical protein